MLSTRNSSSVSLKIVREAGPLSAVVDGKASMRDEKPTRTTCEYLGLIDWFQVCHAQTGATSLVRVWAEDAGKGTSHIIATTFSATPDLSSDSPPSWVAAKSSVNDIRILSRGDYNNDSINSYPVPGAPNHVVTALEHRNSDEVNSLPYEVTIRKEYVSATVSNKGRGWQGFGTIQTLNIPDGVEIIDDSHLIWPFMCQTR
ncbi:uncharacterized protein FTOL_09811 [Fusarium torulosum]|uniref:Uncharacterized protein n=1 Tax=Fusarium torulosum TaxID=33205 RepID=A0AAE8MF20_9HYPO|nr:uncharacterized protein FTOL_09811 [Fusarium torulosum]